MKWFRTPALVRARLLAIALASAVVGGACGDAPAASPPQPEPPRVEAITVTGKPIANLIEVPGRLAAFRTAEVRARVDGIVERRVYDEGSDVRAGDVLFVIDPRPLRAQLAAAEAALERAEATAANAAQDVHRYQGLVAERAISQQEYDAAEARARTAQADVAQARAQVEAAQLDLGYTTVRAPISGRADRAEVTEGALVSAAAATLLTRIEQIDPIYVNFSQTSAERLAIRRAIESGEIEIQAPDQVLLHLVLEDGSLYERAGRLDFFALRVDEATGTAALRAQFPNPERELIPGQFVRARAEAGRRPGAILVPQRAVTLTPRGGTVMVVNVDGVAASRQVSLGELRGDQWVVLSGLGEGDRVIVSGLQRVRPGQPVRAQESAAPDAPAGAATPSP